MPNQFAIDVARIRDHARTQINAGPVTAGNIADRERVIDILNDVVATEIVCYLRYSRHAIVATGLDRAPIAAEFTENAAQELRHALWAAERIDQLGGKPTFDPATPAQRSHAEYAETKGPDLKGMLTENLVAERIVITTYQEIIRWIDDDDPTTKRLLEQILAEEEEHADELSTLLG